MNTFSLLVLIVYITIMVYVVYKARESVVEEKQKRQEADLDGKVVLTIEVEKLQAALDSQVEDLNLRGEMTLAIPQAPLITLGGLNTLPLYVENRTRTYALFVEWQQSSLTNLNGQAQALACLTPNLGQSQSPSLVPPEGKLQETFRVATADGELQPLVDQELLWVMLNKKIPCQLSLRFLLRLQEVGRYQNSYTVVVSCPCSFRMATVQDLAKR
ncbi:hypothetical protein [Prochlorothrix hollandica]|uniref:hypothetical protein n=1 Tax=Prochlorothrix hollandica TaxID=1223 RepID=UPI000345E673|nr:hypothetical protein [Prochlorothrix hollandica]